MPAAPASQRGFTLVELIVTIAVAAILLAIAVPSFRSALDRARLRGVADNVVGVVASARQEAIKQDRLVKVRVLTSGTGFCVGASVVATAATTGCDCASAPSTCTIAVFPSAAADLDNVSLNSSPSFGGTDGFAIDPKTGIVDPITASGNIDLQGGSNYVTRVAVNAMGRATMCTPSVSGKTGLFGVEACP